MKPLYFTAFTIFIFLLYQCSSEKKDDKVNINAYRTERTENGSNRNVNQKDTAGFYETYKYTNRFVWQKPDIIIDLLGDLSEKTVADIGTGYGYFSLRLARKAKKVIAIDIDERMIDYLDSVKVYELPEPFQDRLETRLAASQDPKLMPEEVDGVVIVNTYMYIPNRKEYLKTIKKGIKQGGKLLIVDFKKKRTPVGPPTEARVPLYMVEEELYEAGYKNVTTLDMQLDYQYIILAEI